MDGEATNDTRPKRGFFLHMCLFAAFWVSLSSALGFFYWNTYAEDHPEIQVHPPSWILMTLGVIFLVNLVLVLLVSRWRKWAFWALIALSVISSVLHYLGFGSIALPVMWVALLFVLFLAMRPKWESFR